ncbi:MAG: DUF1883 domain-containing protein [Pirellulales bacterium]
MTYLHYPFRIGPHEFVEVRLDRQAHVRLMDDANFWAYRSGRKHRHYGGLAISTPVRLEPPRPGYWHVVVDLGGIGGRVRASAAVLNQDGQPVPSGKARPQAAYQATPQLGS